jgi:hypothetical protein
MNEQFPFAILHHTIKMLEVNKSNLADFVKRLDEPGYWQKWCEITVEALRTVISIEKGDTPMPNTTNPATNVHETTARPDVKEILYQQLQLLAEQSKNKQPEYSCMLTHSMVEVADRLLAVEPAKFDPVEFAKTMIDMLSQSER